MRPRAAESRQRLPGVGGFFCVRVAALIGDTMRSLVLLAALASSAAAEQIDFVVSYPGGSRLSFYDSIGSAPGMSAHWALRASVAVERPITETPMLWSFDETNAANYGLDWSSFQDWSQGLAGITFATAYAPQVEIGSSIESPLQMLARGGSNGGGPLGVGRLNIWDVDVDAHFTNLIFDRIEYTLFYNVNFPWLKSSKSEWRLYGSGNLVPEPATVLLVALSLLGFVIVRPAHRIPA
jgi:hypothetical protein